MTSKRSASAARQAAIKEIEALQATQNAAWEDVRGTVKICDHCGHTYFPKDTPDYEAWQAAYWASRAGVAKHVYAGTITLAIALERFDISRQEIEVDVRRLAREDANKALASITS